MLIMADAWESKYYLSKEKWPRAPAQRRIILPLDVSCQNPGL